MPAAASRSASQSMALRIWAGVAPTHFSVPKTAVRSRALTRKTLEMTTTAMLTMSRLRKATGIPRVVR